MEKQPRQQEIQAILEKGGRGPESGQHDDVSEGLIRLYVQSMYKEGR